MDPHQPLFGAVDAASIARVNAAPPKIGYTTFGSRANPCVIVPPGGGSTKEENFFWARELAELGPFFVVAYDVRGTGASNPPAYAEGIQRVFRESGTTPVREMERVLGIVHEDDEAEGGAEGPETDRSGKGAFAIVHSRKRGPGALNPAVSDRLPDFRAYVEDAFAVLDELNIERAHFCGLSQGGALARMAATARPERVLSCVACAGAAGKLGVMMAALSAGAEDFQDQIKAKGLYTKRGKMSLDGERELGTANPGYWEPSPGGAATGAWSGEPARIVERADYVKWRSALLEIIAPGHEAGVYEEMASKSYDVGFVNEEQIAVAVLAYEAYERGGWERAHMEALRRNGADGAHGGAVPIMYVHGQKDPVVHFGELQKLFSVTRNCVKNEHEYGHNFGPGGREQTRILSSMARFMSQQGKLRTAARAGGAAGGASGSIAVAPGDPGSTWTSGDAPSLKILEDVVIDAPVAAIYDAFCLAQTAADTAHCFGILLEKVQLKHLLQDGASVAGAPPKLPGLELFLALQSALNEGGLNFRQKALLRNLHDCLIRAQKVVGRARHGSAAAPGSNAKGREVKDVLQETVVLAQDAGGCACNDVLVCGAGPVGLRAAVELALLGFKVRVVEKRPNFSRANILTFWDETMQDMLSLGAKTYFPGLQPTGKQKILGTRQIQVCLLKTLLLLGGDVRYGREICGLVPPGVAGGKWRARFRPYVPHRRACEQEQAAQREGAERGGPEGVESAVDFQKAKDYGGKEAATIEEWAVDEAFISGAGSGAGAAVSDGDGETLVPFDFYIIAEGGWSDSTQKLGFNKAVDLFKPVFGLVANLKYDPSDLKEKNMSSQIHFCLGKGWPLTRCPIQAEFIEYLKLETHFFALVVSRRNAHAGQTDRYLERLSEKERAQMPEELVEELRRNASQKGLMEMGVFREDAGGSAKALLRRENVDAGRLEELVRLITQEMGLPETTPFCDTNGIQLFDFSRRARCVEPVRVLRAAGAGGEPVAESARVLGAAEYLAEGTGSGAGGSAARATDALLLPVGDALQEPVWTQGLGINRGFHTAMNQAYVCLLAREKKLSDAIKEARAVHHCVLGMKWGVGHSGLAGSGSGDIGLKAYRQWDSDPRNRLPYK